VVGSILRNLSILLGQPFEDLRALNRYRKSLAATTAGPAAEPAWPAPSAAAPPHMN
jgi:hypothetical protein